MIVTPDGEVTSRYDKVRRVPFGEYVPLRGLLDALGAPVDQVPNDAVPGTEPAYLDLPDGTRLGVVISWEVFFGGRARDGVREGADLVINPTNGASYSGTIVQTQQIASSRLRALETGRWVVQAAPTGFSAFVSPDGDVLERTAVSERAVIRHDVELRSGETWYTRLGDGPVILVMIARPGGDVVDVDSRSTVTGPSLTSATRISAPNRPVATVAPSYERGDDVGDERLGVLRTSGGDPTGTTTGRVSPYNVNWLTTRTSAPRSLADRFITPASSSNTRRFHSLRAIHSASASVSSWVTPTSTQRPRPIDPTGSPDRRLRWRSSPPLLTLADSKVEIIGHVTNPCP